MKVIKRVKAFGGWQIQCEHESVVVNCPMRFSIFLPETSEKQSLPALYWLSGLTCTDENFSTKSGAQRYAAEKNIILVMPDTSPRGEGVADDPDGQYDCGLGAGFYVNATQAPWRAHYQMYDYVLKELPALVEKEFPVTDKKAIAGHSMGGHGALVLALRNSDQYSSVSAFSPICHPSACAWGKKAFTAYLGPDESHWSSYDACELLKDVSPTLPLLIDQGSADEFYPQQLLTEDFQEAAKRVNYSIECRFHDGYDHSYYFISSFIGDHINFHAQHLYA